MRIGVQRGYTLPRVLAERTLPQLADAGRRASPKTRCSGARSRTCRRSFSAADRERLTTAYRDAIETKVVPSYRKLHDFMRDEYLPKTRHERRHGRAAGRQGLVCLQRARITTTDYTPAQIHQIGLDEVKRIHGEMDAVMKQVGFKGTRDEFFKHMNTDPQFFFDDRDDLIAGYDAISKRVEPAAAEAVRNPAEGRLRSAGGRAVP